MPRKQKKQWIDVNSDGTAVGDTPWAVSTSKIEDPGIGNSAVFQLTDVAEVKGTKTIQNDDAEIEELSDSWAVKHGLKASEIEAAIREQFQIAYGIIDDMQEEDERKKEEERRLTQADLILSYVSERAVEFFKNEDDTAHASVPVNSHIEIHRIRSMGFRRWILRLYYLKHKQTPSSQALQDSIDVCEANAIFEGETLPVFTRVGMLDNRIYLDLCNSDWQVVEISEKGWQAKKPIIKPVLPTSLLDIASSIR